MASCKYYKLVRQVSYDSGVTWISLDEYQKGDLYENDSPDCGGGITQYRWVNVSGEYTCVGTTKYQKTKKQQSTDGGQTWVDVNPPEYSTGAVIERDSSDCGGGSGYENQYLTLVANGNGVFKKVNHSGTFQYSKDEGYTWATATSATTISVSNGDRVMFKGNLRPSGGAQTIYDGVGTFSASTNFAAEGNPMSLSYGDSFMTETALTSSYAFAKLFKGCTSLTSIQNLKLVVTRMYDYCYESMFEGCSSLTSIPSDLLPATTLAQFCYQAMFNGCTSLTSIPSNLLPARTLDAACYRYMFRNCTNLTSIPSDLLPTTTLAAHCYYGMFESCTSLASLPSNLLPATTLKSECYYSMFESCTSLTSIPNGFLPATTLAIACYTRMFYGCTNIATVPSNLLPATTLAEACYSSMFYRCTSLTTAPDLLAPILVKRCYYWMFADCSSLTYIKCLATDISATECTRYWTAGNISESGTFVKSSSMNDWTRGDSGIPNNWTVQNA